MERWANKVAVVTGASSGIGAAIAIELAKQGMIVVGIARRLERMQEMIKKLGKVKGSLHAKRLDVTKSAEIPILFKEIKKEFGGVDVLVNNAGILKSEFLLSESPNQDILDLINTNVVALTIFSREAIADMKERKQPGHIFNINSILGHRLILMKEVNMCLYGAAKHAVTCINETTRFELAQQDANIRVSSISPGMVYTDIFEVGKLQLHPDSIGITPEDVANSLIYILGLPQNILIQELMIKYTNEKY